MNAHQILSLSRPITALVVLAMNMVVTAPQEPRFALYAIAAGLFIATSGIVIGWIPSSPQWRAAALWVEIVAAGVLNYIASIYLPDGPMPVLFMPIIVTVGLGVERRRLWFSMAAVLLIVACTSLPRLRGNLLSAIDITLYGGMILFAASVGLLIRGLTEQKERSDVLLKQVNEAHTALERANRQLQETAAQQQEVAVLEERQRLAREIHDSVAHGLTALVVQLQVGKKLAERVPHESAGHFERCVEMARDALQETRRALRALHPAGLEQHNDVEALSRLARDYGMATSMDVTVEADERAIALPLDPARLQQLYRIFQESLTNAHRHGSATKVVASVSVVDGHLILQICNNGTVPDHFEPGIGLRSMRERARSLGGSVRVELGTGELCVCVDVPLRLEGE